MVQVIDPSVTDEADPVLGRSPSSTCTTPTTAGGRGPSRRSYDREWLARYRAAQRGARRSHRRDRHRGARATSRRHARAARRARPRGELGGWIDAAPARGVHARTSPSTARWPTRPTSTCRSTPTTARSASLFAFPDPLDANYGYGGLARTMTRAGLAVDVVGRCRRGAARRHDAGRRRLPTLIVHPTGDTEIRLRQAERDRDAAGADDVTYVELKGAPHYLERHRPQALSHVADWMADSVPVQLRRHPPLRFGWLLLASLGNASSVAAVRSAVHGRTHRPRQARCPTNCDRNAPLTASLAQLGRLRAQGGLSARRRRSWPARRRAGRGSGRCAGGDVLGDLGPRLVGGAARR